MDPQRASELLTGARAATEAELRRVHPDGADPDPDDQGTRAAELTTRDTDQAMVELLTRRLEAIERAEQRLAAGTYGLSILSGAPIPDARLEIEPWAELTVEEASRA